MVTVPNFFRNDRGQAITLEGITAALIVISAVLFAVSTTSIAPFVSNSADQSTIADNNNLATDTLQIASVRDGLAHDAVFSHVTVTAFTDPSRAADAGYIVADVAEETIIDKGRTYNMYVLYTNASTGEREQRPIVYTGEPSETAATVSVPVAIYDDMDSPYSDTTVENSPFYADDIDTNSQLYQSMKIRLVVWEV